MALPLQHASQYLRCALAKPTSFLDVSKKKEFVCDIRRLPHSCGTLPNCDSLPAIRRSRHVPATRRPPWSAPRAAPRVSAATQRWLPTTGISAATESTLPALDRHSNTGALCSLRLNLVRQRMCPAGCRRVFTVNARLLAAYKFVFFSCRACHIGRLLAQSSGEVGQKSRRFGACLYLCVRCVCVRCVRVRLHWCFTAFVLPASVGHCFVLPVYESAFSATPTTNTCEMRNSQMSQAQIKIAENLPGQTGTPSNAFLGMVSLGGPTHCAQSSMRTLLRRAFADCLNLCAVHCTEFFYVLLRAERTITMTGTPEGVQTALYMIQQRMQEAMAMGAPNQ